MAFNLADILKDVSSSDTGREQIEYIPLAQIDEDPNNFYQLTDVPALADNIAMCGLQQPIRVRQKQDGRYIIVSGHRRRAALEMLVADGYEKWKEAPCIVERDEASPALQQLRLIYANSNTRKMSAAEISEQAVQVEKLLYQLKEDGFDFPGRMRDHVAEAVQVSKSKLARLKVIRENLDESWADAFKDGTLNESQAYALALMPGFWQHIIKEKWGYSIASLTADTITKFRNRFNDVEKIQCSHGLNHCEHSVPMMEKNVCTDWCAPCTGCCFDCTSLRTCPKCCPEALAKKKELKAVEKQAKADAAAEQAERERPGTEFARLVWDRIGKARQRSGCTVEDLSKARGDGYYSKTYDDEKQERMESGEGSYSPYSTVSFGHSIHAQDLMRIVTVADTLKCSVDYLLGRTEDRESHLSFIEAVCPFEDKVPNQGTQWQPGNPKKVGVYLVRISFGKYVDDQYEKLMWGGSEWHDGMSVHEPEVDGDILGWIPMPGIQEAEVKA